MAMIPGMRQQKTASPIHDNVSTINHAALYGSVPVSAICYTGLVNCLVTKFTMIFIVTLANIFTVVTVRRLVLHNPS
jgi:hypothetical protein